MYFSRASTKNKIRFISLWEVKAYTHSFAILNVKNYSVNVSAWCSGLRENSYQLQSYVAFNEVWWED
jgi:hypothetical protein